MSLLIRPETVADQPAVQQLIEAAFRPDARPDGPVVEAVLNDHLRRDPAWIPELTLVAELDGAIAGQVTSSYGTVQPAHAGAAARRVVAIGPVAVRPDRQRVGIGSSLLLALIEAADQAGEPTVVLLGSPDFYGRFGFVAGSDRGVHAPDPAWGKFFQVRNMAPAADIAGRFQYAAPFDEL